MSGKLIFISIVFVTSIGVTWHVATKFEGLETWQSKVGAVIGAFVFIGAMFYLLVSAFMSPLQ